jgi:DNA polymerase-1
MDARPKLYLIDGHAVAYRQFFAIKADGRFTTSKGEPTNATFGFARILLNILQKDKPEYLAVSFDMGMSGRETLYSEYKGTREKMPDDLARQLERISQVVQAFNIPILAMEDYEADDMIGTAAQQAESLGLHTHIVTGDRDILQLLTPHVTVQLPDRGGPDKIYDEALFRTEWGIEPLQLVDWKGLVGDASDNIPGVRGIGEKTATTLLQTYATLDGIYAHINDIKGALQTKLIEGRDSAYLSRELATIKRDLPIKVDLTTCVAHEFDRNVVAEIFRELEFRQLSRDLGKVDHDKGAELEETDSDAEPIVCVIIDDEASLTQLVTTLNSAKAIVWDVETTSTDQMAAELVGIAIAVDGTTGYYIPVGHQRAGELPLFEATAEQGPPIKQLPLAMVINALRDPFTNPKIPKHAHNAVYDLVVMQRYGIDVTPITFDTMVAEWMRDTTSRFLGLKNFAYQYLRVNMTEIAELIGSGKKQITMDLVPVEQAAPYAAADAVVTYRAVQYLQPLLEQHPRMWELFNTLEMPLIPVIAAMEQWGVALDTDFLRQMSVELDVELRRIEGEIRTVSGVSDFNISSPKQLNDVLFEKLKLPVEGLKKTQHGYSTDAATLENLKDAHPIVELILQHREVSKLKGTYVDALPLLVNPRTGRVHTNYNQTGASTGRFSSNNPNLQNIPIRTELGRQVRRAFIAPLGTKLLAVDYSQVELRILAHVGQDKTLLEAFHQNLDIHKATAAAVYGVPIDQVTYEQRSFAKRVNFGLIYGMGAYRLMRDSDLTLAEAQAFIKTYFERLPGVERYLEDTKRKATENGYVETLFGRRGEFGALKNPSTGQQIRQALERAAINMPIQGTAADIMKKAMITLYEELQRQNLDAKMILQVHDELVLEVPDGQVSQTRDLVVQVMENVCELDAPLRANAQVGHNWRDMEPA